MTHWYFPSCMHVQSVVNGLWEDNRVYWAASIVHLIYYSTLQGNFTSMGTISRNNATVML